MRGLILSPEPPARGILQSLAAHGVEPIVARAKGDPETVGQVRYERVPARGDPHDPSDFRWSRKPLRELVRDIRPDLIHLIGDPWTPTAETGAAAARDLKVPYVVVGTSSLGGPRGLTARWQANKVRDGAVGLAGITKPALDLLSADASPGARAVLPQLGFEIPGYAPTRPPNGSVLFTVVGRIVPERGIDLLFDALADVFGDWRLQIVGTGPSQEPLEAQAQRLGLSARIDWLGAVPRQELGGLWTSADAILSPSRSTPTWVEPSGSVVLEAMAWGVSAIVSRCGALPDVVGDAGMVIDEGDRPALSRAMSRLVEDPSRARTLGALARQRVLEHYGDGPIAERMAKFWKESLKA
jgi:glycosyltransferase involved in cell wall biosynthesis